MFFLYQVAFFVYPGGLGLFHPGPVRLGPGDDRRLARAFGIAIAAVQGGLIRVILKRGSASGSR
jgi:hypothetical protein